MLHSRSQLHIDKPDILILQPHILQLIINQDKLAFVLFFLEVKIAQKKKKQTPSDHTFITRPHDCYVRLEIQMTAMVWFSQ